MFFGLKAVESELLLITDLDYATKHLELSKRELLAEPHSYVDRFGEYKAPFGVAVKVAEHCCKRFSRDVLRYVQAEEDALKESLALGYYTFPNRGYGNWRSKDGFEILCERAEEWLTEEAPVFSLVREWCGKEATDEFDQVLVLREEVDCLSKLTEDTAR